MFKLFKLVVAAAVGLDGLEHVFRDPHFNVYVVLLGSGGAGGVMDLLLLQPPVASCKP